VVVQFLFTRDVVESMILFCWELVLKGRVQETGPAWNVRAFSSSITNRPEHQFRGCDLVHWTIHTGWILFKKRRGLIYANNVRTVVERRLLVSLGNGALALGLACSPPNKHQHRTAIDHQRWVRNHHISHPLKSVRRSLMRRSKVRPRSVVCPRPLWSIY